MYNLKSTTKTKAKKVTRKLNIDILLSIGDRSTMVVHQLVELGVAGSNPVGHPSFDENLLLCLVVWEL